MQNTVNLTWTTSSADCHFGSSQINCTTIKLIGVTNALQKIHLTWTTDIADCYFRPSQINCNGHNFKYSHSWRKPIDSISQSHQVLHVPRNRRAFAHNTGIKSLSDIAAWDFGDILAISSYFGLFCECSQEQYPPTPYVCICSHLVDPPSPL